MIELKKYTALKNIDRRTAYRWAQDEKIYIDKGKVFDPELGQFSSLPREAKQVVIKSIKQKLNQLIYKASNHPGKREEVRQQILKDVEKYRSMGLGIGGYSPKSIDRKIKNPGKLVRKTRNDFNKRRNPVLSSEEAYSKLIALAYHFFMEDRSASVLAQAKLIRDYAKEHQEFYELADEKNLPFKTMLDRLYRGFFNLGIREKHTMKYHYNQWLKGKPYNAGFFTNSNFGDYLIIDDHIQEVAGAYVFNELRGELELKKVYTWTIIEGKTWQVIAHKSKTEDFNANDIKLLIVQALMNFGKPNICILMDNGLASSEDNLAMLDKLGVDYDPGPAYTPLHKAPIERSFGAVKREYCARWENYIGGSRAEVAHSGKKLSPEQCTYLASEFINKFDDYIEGRWQTVLRDRTDKGGKKLKISIRDWYNECWLKHEPKMIDEQELAFHYMKGVEKKLTWSHVDLGKHGLYLPKRALSPVICNPRNKFLIKYNPLDMRHAWAYSLQPIEDENTGESIAYMGLVCKLDSAMIMETPELQERNARLQKGFRKLTGKAGKSIADLIIAKNVTAFAPELNKKENGAIVIPRKELERRATEMLEDDKNKIIDNLTESIRKGVPEPEQQAPANAKPDYMSDEQWAEVEALAKKYDEPNN